MASIDWTKIRMEYISSDCTYRDLAKKHGIALSGIARIAKQEDWQKAKEQHRNKIATKIEQKVIEKKARSFTDFAPVLEQGIVDISTKLLAKINETMEYGDAFSPRDLKSLSSMVNDLGILLKDVKEDMNAGTAAADKVVVEFVNNEWDGDMNADA